MAEDKTIYEKQQYVSDIIGQWLEDFDINLLAKEGELVYWESITGEPEDYSWHKMTVAEASRVVKVMLVPPQYMQYCTVDAIYTACQEQGRAFIQGVESHKKVSYQYFNYLEHQRVKPNRFYEVVYNTVKHCWDEYKTVEWMCLRGWIEKIAQSLDIPIPDTRSFNKYIKQAGKECGYTICHDKTRYTWDNKKWSCLRVPDKIGVDFNYGIDTDTIFERLQRKAK